MPSARALRVIALAKSSSSPLMASAITAAASLAERVTRPFRSEVAIVFREAVLNGAAERGLIARGGDLLTVRKARSVLVDGLAHAKRARLARHRLGEIVLVAADGFGDHCGCVVGGAGHEALPI